MKILKHIGAGMTFGLCLLLMVTACSETTTTESNNLDEGVRNASTTPKPVQEEKKSGPYGFETTEHQFGTVEKGTVVEKTYVYHNKSAKPYVINNVITSCPCMKAEYSTDPVEPGGSGEVRVSFDTKDQFEATYEKIISVVFQGDQQPVPLFLKGKIIEKK